MAGEEVLHFDRARGGAWMDSSNNQWMTTVLEWDAGKKVSAMDSRHNPMICLPASGLRLKEQFGVFHVSTEMGKVPFTGYLFEQPNGGDVFVFSGVIRPLDLPEPIYRSGRIERRLTQLEKAILGNRQSPERILLIALAGPSDYETAQSSLRAALPGWVQPQAGAEK